MEFVSKLVSETKQMAAEEEDLRKEVSGLKCESLMEELNLKLLKKDHDLLKLQAADLERSLDASTRLGRTIESFRNITRTSFLMHHFLEEFIDKMDPNEAQQLTKLASIQKSYEKMLKEYEDSPAYQAILEAEVAGKEMMQKIQDKNNEKMKLETEQDFTS